MPKVKALKPLLNLCLECIYRSIETSSLWLSEDEPDDISVELLNKKTWATRNVNEMQNVNSMTHHQEFNPFHQLPTILLEEIMNRYIKNGFRMGLKPKPVKNKILEYFITPQLKHLHFLFYSEKFLELFPNFGAVEYLDFTLSKAGDNCLKIVGINCKKLRTLNISGCSQVTDIGIQWLCVGGDPLDAKCGIKNELCKTLRRLVMLGTGATKKGVHFALKNLLVMESLENEMIFEVLVEFLDAAFDQLMSDNSNLFFGRLRIKNFRSFRSNIFGQVITQLCPLLNELWITEKELKNPDLLPFVSHLNKLRGFSLKSYDAKNVQEMTFYSHLVPILEVIGKSLETISVPSVDIWVIIKLCPNLTKISFKNHFGSISVTSSKAKGDFQIMEKNQLILKKLKTLCCQTDISPEILDFFLSCPLLVKICFLGCFIITDDFLKETRSLYKIEDIAFGLCDLVTIQGINALMIDRSSLKSITFVHCKNITLDHVYDLRALADEKNWNLRLRYKNGESYDLTPSCSIVDSF